MKSKPGLLLLIATVSWGVVAAQEYEGPTVLSRSGGGIRPYGQRVGDEAKMRVFISAEAIYDYGFVPISTGSTGAVNRSSPRRVSAATAASRRDRSSSWVARSAVH